MLLIRPDLTRAGPGRRAGRRRGGGPAEGVRGLAMPQIRADPLPAGRGLRGALTGAGMPQAFKDGRCP